MIEYKKPKVVLLHASPLYVGEIGARVCYDSFDLSEHEDIRNFREDNDIFLNKPDITESKVLDKLVHAYHHESIIEHITLSFWIENVSREIIIELNRHRIGIATSQKSSRYTMEDMVNAWIDWNTAVRESHSNDEASHLFNVFLEIVKSNIVDEDDRMVTITANYISNKLDVYNTDELLLKDLTGSKKKAQNDRVKRCLPEVYMTDGVWTFNLRALKHFKELRDSGAAYPYMQELAKEILSTVPQKYLTLL